jgi:ribosomal protein L17
MLTMRKRNELRRIQDRIIKHAERRGIPDHRPASTRLPCTVTVGALRRLIFPEHERELRDLLVYLSQR